MSSDRSRVIAVLGPTAAGKSAFAASLAQRLDSEVVSGDSMQVYQGLDIGTAKATGQERMGVPHHMLDLRSPLEGFSAAEYQALAREAIADILRRGKTPILAGGTGLYIDSALYNYAYGTEGAAPAPDFAYGDRQGESEAAQPASWERLRMADPVSAARIHPNDTKRIRRALDYAQAHGKPISQNRAARNAPELMYPTVFFGLHLPRQTLYQRIDARVDSMMGAGLLAEVASLRGQGLRADSQAGQAIGYRQLLRFLDLAQVSGFGHREYDEALARAVEEIKRESRRYAKRQLTWFRRNPAIVWLHGDMAREDGAVDAIARMLRHSWERGDFGEIMEFAREKGLLFPIGPCKAFPRG